MKSNFCFVLDKNLTILICIISRRAQWLHFREEAYELFMHGYRSYMDYAYPADELMPLTCKGRYRGITPSRGDVDDSLGKWGFLFSLNPSIYFFQLLVDSDRFSGHGGRAGRSWWVRRCYQGWQKFRGKNELINCNFQKVIEEVRFDSDFVVSVFETNIRILGGLLSGLCHFS